MKKRFMSGLLVLTIGFAYANSSLKQKVNYTPETQKEFMTYKIVEKPNAECSVSVTYYSNGLAMHKEVYSAEFSTMAACESFQKNMINFLEACGYRVEREF